MSYKGNNILGDKKYKKKYKKIKNINQNLEKLIYNLDRQFLHAKVIGFVQDACFYFHDIVEGPLDPKKLISAPKGPTGAQTGPGLGILNYRVQKSWFNFADDTVNS